MKYKLINKSNTSNKTLHRIIQFVCPKNLNDFIVKVCNNNAEYISGEAFRKSVVIDIDRHSVSPRKIDAKSIAKFGYLNNCIAKNKIEVLVTIIAHELRHLWQLRISTQNFNKERTQIYNCPLTGELYKVGYKSEKDASLYGKKMLLRWRKWKQK